MRSVLIVVDMQNDFISGTLGGEAAQEILPHVREKIKQYRERGEAECGIVFTQDTHEADYLSTPEGKLLPVEHCIRNSVGWRIHESLAKRGDYCIEKRYFGYDWSAEAMLEGVQEIELVGVCTDI